MLSADFCPAVRAPYDVLSPEGVGHDKFDAMQTTGLQPEQEIAPARPALAVGELDRQHLTAAVPVDADRDQHRLAGDHAGLAHPLIARVEDQIGEGFGQGATGKLRQTRIQPLVHCTDRLLEAETYCPPTPDRGADLLPVPSPLRRDRAHCQAIRLRWCSASRNSAARRVGSLHTRMDDGRIGGASSASYRTAVFA